MAAVAVPEIETPYASAPSSPRGFFASAPASPSHGHSSSSVPFFWEESPGTPKRAGPDDSAAFEFGHPQGAASPATADELFDRGVIRPLKPPPRLHPVSAASSPRGNPSRSPKARTRLEEDFDPFERAMEEATRGRSAFPASGGDTRRSARSLSPLRGVLGFHWGSNGGGGWKLKLRELFLFRSKSEGRVTGNRNRDVLRKYTVGPRVAVGAAVADDARNSSFRSVESYGSARRIAARDPSGSVGGSSRRGVSPHELHYTAKRAVAEEQKKKTFLPYRQGLLSCLGFTPQIPIHDLAKSFVESFSGHHRR